MSAPLHKPSSFFRPEERGDDEQRDEVVRLCFLLDLVGAVLIGAAGAVLLGWLLKVAP